MRQTSIDVYHKIEREGLLSKMRFLVYKEIFEHAPITCGELYHRHLNHIQQNTITPRMAELEKQNVIRVIDKRECGITGQLCSVWDVTNELPIKLKNNESKTDQKIKEAILKEREECARIADSYSEIAATIIRNKT